MIYEIIKVSYGRLDLEAERGAVVAVDIGKRYDEFSIGDVVILEQHRDTWTLHKTTDAWETVNCQTKDRMDGDGEDIKDEDTFAYYQDETIEWLCGNGEAYGHSGELYERLDDYGYTCGPMVSHLRLVS